MTVELLVTNTSALERDEPVFGDGIWCKCSLKTRGGGSFSFSSVNADEIVVIFHPLCPLHRKMSRREFRKMLSRINGRAGRIIGQSANPYALKRRARIAANAAIGQEIRDRLAKKKEITT